MSRFTFKFFVALVIVAFSASAIMAQGFQVGTISGTVQDETGGAIPGVTVTATSEQRGTVRTETTGSDGEYRFPSMPLGRYTVTGELQGFQTFSARNVLVEQDKTTDIDMTLRLAAESVEITVTGEAPVVDPTNPAVNTRVSRDEFEFAPVARGYQALMTLAPGVVDQPGNPSGGNPQVHGAQNTANVYLFDGVDTTDTTTGTFGTNYNFEAIQEVNVYTSGTSAEYGRATGAILNVVTKSGTNDFEGSLKAIATNDKWNEQNKTTNPVTGVSFARTKNDVDNIRYSATLGGPVWRDHVWFFGAYETFEESTAPAQTSVTNEEYIANREITLEHYRLTTQLTPSINVWAKYATDPFVGIIRDYWGASPELFSLTAQDQGGDQWAIQGTGVISSNFVAEAMYAESGSTITVAPYLISPLHNGAPHLSLADNKYYNGATFDGFVDRPRTQALGAVSYYTTLAGQNHNFKLGVDWQELKSSNLFAFPNGQLFIDNSFDPFTRQFDPNLRLDFDVGPSTSVGEIMALYLRDKFEVGNRLFFEAGLRFEQQTGENDLGETVLDTSVIAPRLMASYDLTGSGRTLLNATVGRFYQSVIQDFSDNFATVPQQTNYDLYVWNGSEYEFASRFEAGAGALEPNLGLDPVHLDEVTLGFQQQLGTSMAVGIRGIYREWGDLIDDLLFFDGPENIVTQYVNLDEAERDYRGLELTFEKRFSNNWSALANYTYGETRGNHFGTLVSQVGDFLDADCQVSSDSTVGIVPCSELNTGRLQGRPSWDIPHLVNVLAAYSRPIGPINLAVGTSGTWASGNSFSKNATALVLDPFNNEDSGQTQAYFYEGQGSDRMPDWWQLNLSTEVTWRAFNMVDLGVKAEIFNVTDQQEPFVVSQTAWCNGDTPACQTARDRFGLSTSRGAYQAPRNYRVTGLVRF